MTLLLVASCCALAALGSFLFGYDTGIIASAIEQDNFNDRLAGGPMADNVTGAIVSSFTAGAILGTVAVSFLSDRFGRRGAIFVGAAFACVGGALQGGAAAVAMMIAGRAVAGVGIGLLSPTIPNFCMEIAPNNLRGMLGGMQQWMLGLGIVTSQWVGYACSLRGGSLSWRLPLSLQTFPALLLMASIYMIPESPRNLVQRGLNELAAKSLRKYRLDRSGRNKGEIEDELREIQESIRQEQSAMRRATWSTLYKDPAARKSLFLACGIQLFTQTSGINVIGYYGPRIYNALGYTSSSALFIQAIYGALALLWNTICLAVVDRVGRRTLLIPSMIGMGAALCVEALLVYFYDPQTTSNQNALRASVAMNFVFSVFFTSLGVISWIFAGEIFSTPLRARGTAVSTFTNWAANLIFAQCSPLALSKMGYKYFYIFVAFNWLAGLIVWHIYPETQKCSTLESVPQLLGVVQVDGPVANRNGGRTCKSVSVQERECHC